MTRLPIQPISQGSIPIIFHTDTLSVLELSPHTPLIPPFQDFMFEYCRSCGVVGPAPSQTWCFGIKLNNNISAVAVQTRPRSIVWLFPRHGSMAARHSHTGCSSTINWSSLTGICNSTSPVSLSGPPPSASHPSISSPQAGCFDRACKPKLPWPRTLLASRHPLPKASLHVLTRT